MSMKSQRTTSPYKIVYFRVYKFTDNCPLQITNLQHIITGYLGNVWKCCFCGFQVVLYYWTSVKLLYA